MGEIHMLRTDKGIWVEAKLSSEIGCSCSRCLKDFIEPIEVDIQEEFRPRVDVDTGAKLAGLPSPAGIEEDFYISQNHILDLTDAARQYFEMNMPMKPVCTEQCKGICLRCGINRNERICRCDDDQIDPRWSALVDLVTTGTPDAN